MTTSTNLEITHITTAQAQKEVTANAAFNRIDGALGTTYNLILATDVNYDFSTGTPPGETEALTALKIKITSTLTMSVTPRTVTFPANSKLYLIENATTGGFPIKVKPLGAGQSETLQFGEQAFYIVQAGVFVRICTIPGTTNTVHNNHYFGNGADAVVTISGGTTTLTRDMMYEALTVTSTGVLKTAQFRVYVQNYCNVNASGIISCDGNAASVGTAGGSVAAGSLGSNTAAGGNGGTAAGNAGTNETNSGIGIPGTGAVTGGGVGGTGASGAGGAAGTTTPMTATTGNPWDLHHARTGTSPTAVIRCGAGGGGGGGDGTTGGGGGSAAGYMMLAAYTLINNGVIRCNGGAGAQAAGGNRGGGGGGQGGIMVLIYHYYSGAGTKTVTGGVFGALQGTGTNGAAGVDGVKREYAV